MRFRNLPGMTGDLGRGDSAPRPTAPIALRRILWACDFSTGSLEALRWVLPLAGAHASEITAVHVVPTTLPARGGPLALANPALLRPQLHQEARAALTRYAGPAVAAGIATETAVREGNAVHEILELADRLPADLIVQGTRGLGALERSVIGSVAEAVIRRARCPVLTVPMDAHPANPPAPAPILCATDFSPAALRALDHAAAIAARSGAELVLLHVLEPGWSLAGDDPKREAERLLSALAAERGRARALTMTVSGTASQEILRVARDRKAGLVAMGRHGSRAFPSILFGDTARCVVRDAPCAVLTVREA